MWQNPGLQAYRLTAVPVLLLTDRLARESTRYRQAQNPAVVRHEPCLTAHVKLQWVIGEACD